MCMCVCVCVCVCCVCVCVVSVIVKRPVLPPCAVDGRSRYPLYYYYYYIFGVSYLSNWYPDVSLIFCS